MESITYLHDGSFEGLLHAVATAVKSKKVVSGIYGKQGFSPQLFDTLIHLQTDSRQASRLFEYLKKLNGNAARFAMNGFLSGDHEVGIHLYRMVQECLVRGAKTTQLYTHDSIRYLDKLSQKVSSEAHRFTGLIRFRILEDGLQYAPFEPDCNIIGHCALHFRQRLGNIRWILHDIRRDQALYWDGDLLQAIDIDEDFTAHVQQYGEVPEARLNADELHYQELWKSFHTAIANTDRKNLDLQRQFMPRRYWKYLVEMS
ncbi:TIGR03915 family putative DNA repair protein [Desulfopila sp. IMCC35008]|uniref:TIGR03915 family putative DNA repair protein n=1 Tax=Desulfopila sp. IMCC35008 TaxID=2653858 RepID=UPI0013D74884|nr:TIGR03915 family putative DNA repair protein [Desulfopila sp. IMCC35008]